MSSVCIFVDGCMYVHLYMVHLPPCGLMYTYIPTHVHCIYRRTFLCTHLRWVPSDVLQWGCETYRTRTGHFGRIHLSHDLLPVGLLHCTR